MSILNAVVFFMAILINQSCLSNSWSNLYLGLTLGDLTKNYESQQIQLAEHNTLFSESYNLSIDRGFIYSPQSTWLKKYRIRLDSYSTLETYQHGSVIDIEKISHHLNMYPSIGVSGLINTDEHFGFVQTNIGAHKQLGSSQLSIMLNIPIKKQHYYDSSLSQRLYSIADSSRGNNLSNNQKKQVVQAILNQAVTDDTQINTIYNAILDVQSNTMTNRDANYQPVFSQYSDKTASLYDSDLTAANKAGDYDFIAQYGIHAKVARNHIWLTNTFTTAAYTALSLYEKQTIVKAGIDAIDLTGMYKTATPQIQFVYQESQWKVRGALSIRWYLDKPKTKQINFPHEFSVAQQHVNYTTRSFKATNLNA